MTHPETSIEVALKTIQATGPRLLGQYGFRLEPLNYYSPLNNPQLLEDNEDLWSSPFVPLDIDWRIDHQVEVAREVSEYVLELSDIPDHPAPQSGHTYGHGLRVDLQRHWGARGRHDPLMRRYLLRGH